MPDRLSIAGFLAAVLLVTVFPLVAAGEDYDLEPINYSEARTENAVTRLIDDLKLGKVQFQHQAPCGYLKSLLRALKVPESSQTLVYSKTSLQRERIAPETPRAIYFNDNVYVGFCQDGEVLELSTADPQLGAVFYTVSQDAHEPPKITRHGDNCLICHGSALTRRVPGHLIRSVFVEPSGLPILSAETHRIDQTSPISVRWGGWYVTGTHGTEKHRGNLIIQTRTVPDEVDNSAGLNVTSLASRFDTSAYLSPHSDLIALMVLEHQAETHNRITQANFLTRQAMHYQLTLNKELGNPSNHAWDSVKSRIRNGGESLVEYLLFSGEAEIRSPLLGTSGFAAEFSRQGPRDRRGRSLRDFDLQRRIFKYPCSYLIYSPAFQSLPQESQTYIYDRLWNILTGQDKSKAYAHLTAADRQAILEILQDTLPKLPSSWKKPISAVKE